MFSQRQQPSITANPSVSLTATVNGQSLTTTRWFEVGTPLTSLAYNASFSPGSYTAFPGQVATGVEASSWSAQLLNGSTAIQTSNSKDGSFTQLTAADGMTLKVKQTAKHGQGTRAKDNMGADSDPAVRIAADTTGKSSTTAGAAKSYRQGFYGYRLATESPLNFDSMTSQDIRSNIHATAWNFTNGEWPVKFTVPQNST